MASYDYKEGKNRIEDILGNCLEVNENGTIPKDEQFTYDNAYYGWVSAIFVDIRDSSKLFSGVDKKQVSKVIRSFTSEVIEILRQDENLREIGIRGDCVYAIFTTPKIIDIYEVADKTFYINTFMNMLNSLLHANNFPEIKVGIGMSSAQELVVKAGRKDTGINNKVWIGEAVTKASNLSALGNRNGLKPIVFSSCSYENIIESLKKENKIAESWFHQQNDYDNGTYYDADIINMEFNNWVKNGMN